MPDFRILHQAMLKAEHDGELGEARQLARRIIVEHPRVPQVEDARRIYLLWEESEQRARKAQQHMRNRRGVKVFALIAGLLMTTEGLVLLYLAGWWQPRVICAVYSLPGLALILVSIRSFVGESPLPAWAFRLAWVACLVSLLVLGLVPFVYYAMLTAAFMS